MRTTQQLSITLPNAMAKQIKERVSTGEYASESEVIRDALRSLMARDKAMEQWLRNDVMAAYQEAQKNPDSLLDSKQVRTRLTALHKRTEKKSA